MPESVPVETTTARAAAPDAPRASAGITKLVAVTATAGALLGVYLWQIFYTMPQVSVLDPDSASYLHLNPYRTVGIYYFTRSAFAVWNNFYAIALAQACLLGVASLLLFYALQRATGSSLLGLAVLVLCLFKASPLIDTQWVGSDSLFATACLALLAASILVWKKPSPVHIGLFLLFGFLALIIRPVGLAIVGALTLVLALRLWRESRRALGAIAAGSVGLYLATAAVQFAHFGLFAPAQLGYALIGGAGFIADENAASDILYAREFAAATATYRSEYEAAASWEQKFAVMDRYYNPITWRVAVPRLLALTGNDSQPSWDDTISINRRLEDISFAAIRNNPAGYGRMTLVKLMAGASMFFGHAHRDLQMELTRGVADRRIGFARSYLDNIPREPRFGYDDEITRLAQYIRDWQAAPLDLKHDVGRPLRDLVGHLSGDIISRLFALETAVLVVVIAGIALRRRRIDDRVLFLLLFVVPPWCYLLAISVTHIPLPRYMEAATPFVNIALLLTVWAATAAVAERVWPLRRGSRAAATRRT